MKRGARKIETELAVVGTGIAGFAASLFARARGLEVTQAGHSGAIAYTTGYLDLLGVLDGKVQDDPWAALETLRARAPAHPLARLGPEETRNAMAQFAATLSRMGLGYTAPTDRNLHALLPYGATKPTLCVPETMRPGIEACERGSATLIVDFDGLQGFSAREFQLNMAARWPDLRRARLAFPGLEDRQVFPEVMARALETRATRGALADLIRPRLGGASHVGLPAILGMQAPDRVRAEMEALIGARVFELPTMPPAVPGIRLRELFERALPAAGVRLEPQLKVARLALGKEGARLFLHGPMEDIEIEASAVLLATGRFLSGGLASDRSRVWEPLLDLPISQPEDRAGWFRADYLDPRGHAINRLGVGIDSRFRPVDADGRPVNDGLFAAGAVLAGQDWVRERSGAGIAITSAWGAVQAAAERLRA